MDSKTIESERPIIKEPIKDKELNLRVKKLAPGQRGLYHDVLGKRRKELLEESGVRTVPVEERWNIVTKIEDGEITKVEEETDTVFERENRKVEEGHEIVNDPRVESWRAAVSPEDISEERARERLRKEKK